MHSWLQSKNGDEFDQFFNMRFQEVIRVLRGVAREADRRRNELTQNETA